MMGTVKFFRSDRGVGMVRAGLKGDVAIFAEGHVDRYLEDVYERSSPPDSINPGDEVELPIVVSGDKGLRAPAWTWLRPAHRLTIDEVGNLENGHLKFFKTENGYGFIVPAGGEDLFAHAEKYRQVLPDKTLRKLKPEELAEVNFVKKTRVRFVRGEGRDGRPAATLWFLEP